MHTNCYHSRHGTRRKRFHSLFHFMNFVVVHCSAAWVLFMKPMKNDNDNGKSN